MATAISLKSVYNGVWKLRCDSLSGTRFGLSNPAALHRVARVKEAVGKQMSSSINLEADEI